MPAEFDPTDPYKGQEAWQYTGKGRLYIARYTGKYGEVAYEAIHGGRVFHLTPQERRLNSDRVREPRNDPFKNGTCIQIRLVEDTPIDDREAIENNPSILQNEDIVALFKAKSNDALADRLTKIDNPIVLTRILELAEQADLPGSKIGMIREKLTEVAPQDRRMIPATNEQDQPEIYGDMGPRPIAVGE